MNKDYIISEIEKRKDKLKSRGVKKIGLFGSYLEGTQKRGSDIDLLIEFENVSLRGYFGLLRYFENLFKRRVDLVIEEDLKKELDYVKKEAQYIKI